MAFRKKDDEEKARLLAKVAELQAETERLMAKQKQSSTSNKGQLGGILSTKPLTYDDYVKFSIDPISYSFKFDTVTTTATSPEPANPEYAEIKIWRNDGRVETIRCVLSGLRKGSGTGAEVAFTGRMKPWKFGPDGRPKP